MLLPVENCHRTNSLPNGGHTKGLKVVFSFQQPDADGDEYVSCAPVGHVLLLAQDAGLAGRACRPEVLVAEVRVIEGQEDCEGGEVPQVHSYGLAS